MISLLNHKKMKKVLLLLTGFLINMMITNYIVAGNDPLHKFLVKKITCQNVEIKCAFAVNHSNRTKAKFYYLLPNNIQTTTIDVKKIQFGNSYVSSSHFSGQLIEQHEIIKIRDYNILRVIIDPHILFPGGKCITVTELEIKIAFEPIHKSVKRSPYPNKFWNQIIGRLVINPQSLPKIPTVKNMFADVNGDDLPEIVISRLPIKTNIELENYLTRIYNFEYNPPSIPGYYDQPLTVANFGNPYSTSWMTTEIINEFV